MRKSWLKKWFGSSRPAFHRGRRALLTVEALEDRTLLANYVWTGGGLSFKWSDPKNWLADKQAAKFAPDKDDSVTFDSTGFKGKIYSSIVDELFTVNNLTINSSYKKYLKIGAGLSLTVLESTTISGGELTGRGTLFIGSTDPDEKSKAQPSFVWTGGSLSDASGKIIVLDGGTATIKSTSEKAIDGRQLIINPKATLTWTGTGDIKISNSGSLTIKGTANFNTTAKLWGSGDVSISGTGTVNVSVDGKLPIQTPFSNSGKLNVNRGSVDFGAVNK